MWSWTTFAESFTAACAALGVYEAKRAEGSAGHHRGPPRTHLRRTGRIWKVTKETVRNWVADLDDQLVLVPGQRGQMRVYPRNGLGGDRQPPSDHQMSTFGGGFGGEVGGTDNRQVHPIGKVHLALGGRQRPDDVAVEDEYTPGAWDIDEPDATA